VRRLATSYRSGSFSTVCGRKGCPLIIITMRLQQDNGRRGALDYGPAVDGLKRGLGRGPRADACDSPLMADTVDTRPHNVLYLS